MRNDEAGTTLKMKELCRRGARQMLDEFCNHLQRMGIPATVVKRAGSFRRMLGLHLGELGHIKLEGRNIDTVELVCDVAEGPTYRQIRCCIECEMESAGEQLLARTEQK